MRIKWRLAILFLQISLLSGVTWYVTNEPYTGATWYVAGIFAVLINPQLLEPYYPKPADVIGNSTIALLLFLTSDKGVATPGWNILALLLLLSLILALIALIFGAGKKGGSIRPIVKAVSALSREANSVRIYSSIFILSLIDSYSFQSKYFWILVGTWVGLCLIGSVNWQRIWGLVHGSSKETTVEGMIGPSTLLVSSDELPSVGNQVKIHSGSNTIPGTVISRIKRANDVWGKIHILSEKDCEEIVGKESIVISMSENVADTILGLIDVGSNERSIKFDPTNDLSIGEVVAVEQNGRKILYQLYTAYIDNENVKDGSRLHLSSKGAQIGLFDAETLKIKSFDWVPSPGSLVKRPNISVDLENLQVPDNWTQMGNLVGCDVPIYIDKKLLIEGHLAILGMTKMGKTTLAFRLGTDLSSEHLVTILDQTGEYRLKRHVPLQTRERNMNEPSIAVYEPAPGSVAPDIALKCINRVVELARQEYDEMDPYSRIFLLDEAHQFIPEPAVIGYGGVGRESSIQIGSLMMQIRKYGISMILISQRTAVIAKSAISQCENIIAFRSVDQTGLNYLESIVGPEACKFLPLLKQGQALCYGPAFSSETPVIIDCLFEN